MHHVAWRLNNLVRGGGDDIARDTGRETACQRRNETFGDVLAELQRPWLVRNLAVGRIDDEARACLNTKSRFVLLDVL
jgi:hypothetical protein